MNPSRMSEEFRKLGTQVHAWLLLEWLQDQNRKPAMIAFTEGPLRVLARAIEQAISQDGTKDARRYRLLRGSLHAIGADQMSHTKMPRIVEPFHDGLTYTQDGLDAVLDEIAGGQP